MFEWLVWFGLGGWTVFVFAGAFAWRLIGVLGTNRK